MENPKNTERLAGYLIQFGNFAIAAALCWYFRSVLLYIILAFIVSLIGQPLMRMLRKIRIRGAQGPDWLLAIFSLLIIFGGLLLMVTQVIPVITGIFSDASFFTDMHLPDGNLFGHINKWIVSTVPALGPDFDGVDLLTDYLKNVVTGVSVTGILGSVASALSGIAVGLLAVAFISFFFIKDELLFRKIVAALTPDRLEAQVDDALGDIERLLSRYFVGLIIEMLGVTLVNFIGLWAIARIGFLYAIGIAFIAGILNIIPYIGPLIGELLGVLLCVVLKYGAGVGLDVNIWFFALIVLLIMLVAQMVDNFVYQPLIYSRSIQATPLEIFIVILVAGHIGGAIGMLAAIPAYTVLRVIAGRFFRHRKAVRKLMPDLDKEFEHPNN